MDIAFAHPFGGAPGSAIGRRLFRSAVVVGTVAFVVVRAGLGSLGGPVAGGFETDTVFVTAGGEAPMFTLRAIVPGQTVTRDRTITVHGSAPSDLRLFADVSRNALSRSLTVTVTLGTGRGDSFVPYEGTGTDGPVLYRGPLSAFPASWAGGIRVANATRASRTFRFRVGLPARDSEPGLSAAASFIWEARAA